MDITEFLKARLDEIPDLRDAAAVWSDHPDYRQEWAPE